MIHQRIQDKFMFITLLRSRKNTIPNLIVFFFDLIIIDNTFLILCVLPLHRLALGVPVDENSINGYSRCSMYAVNFTQILADGVIKADPKWPTVPCQHGWEFDKEELPYSTISTEVNNNFTYLTSQTCFVLCVCVKIQSYSTNNNCFFFLF